MEMESEQYLKKILSKYRLTFDVTEPYFFRGKNYPAYGYFASSDEKFVLSKKATLWKAKTFEHVLFLTETKCTAKLLSEIGQLMETGMESEMVRKGKRFPEEDHMYSYLTVVIISKCSPDREAVRAAENFRFVKNYLFTIRGRAEGHVVLVDMEKQQVYTNHPREKTADFFISNFE
jgi:hypothetical protein